MDFQNLKLFILHILFPKTCLHCRKDLEFRDTAPLCPECFSRMERIPGLFCNRCGLPLPYGGAHCHACRGGRGDQYKCSLIRAAFVFNPQLRSLVHAFKYKGKTSLARHFGNWLAAAWERYPEIHDSDILSFVPLSQKRLKERGYNQSGLLAKAFAVKTGLALEDGLLKKSKETKSQASLSKAERMENIKNAFEVIDPARVKGKKVLLIDDVCTTGATLEECASALKKAGAQKVSALVLAREPLKDGNSSVKT